MKPLVACLAAVVCALPLSSLAEPKAPTSITVPFALDHNRMLVDAEVRAADGTWTAPPARSRVEGRELGAESFPPRPPHGTAA